MKAIRANRLIWTANILPLTTKTVVERLLTSCKFVARGLLRLLQRCNCERNIVKSVRRSFVENAWVISLLLELNPQTRPKMSP
jgi:hypothetical protein